MNNNILKTRNVFIDTSIIERENRVDQLGPYSDVAICDSAFTLNPWEAARAFVQDEPTIDIVHGDFPAYNIFRTKDNKYLTVANAETKFWIEFCNAMEIPKFKYKAWDQGKKRDKLFQILKEKFSTRTQKEWVKHFNKFQNCVMPVNSYNESITDPHLIARKMIPSVKHPIFGEIPMVNSPIHYSNTPLSIRKYPPSSGEHTFNILRELGYSEKKIETIRKEQKTSRKS